MTESKYKDETNATTTDEGRKGAADHNARAHLEGSDALSSEAGEVAAPHMGGGHTSESLFPQESSKGLGEFVERADFSSPPNRAIFYTHEVEVGDKSINAWKVADTAGGTPNNSDVGWTREMGEDDWTTIGKTPDGAEAFNRVDDACKSGAIDAATRDVLESRISERYAERAKGSVTVYCPPEPNSEEKKQDFWKDAEKKVFYQAEFPALLANDNVTEINGIPREKLAAMDRREAFRELTKSERERTEAVKEWDRKLDTFEREFGRPSD